MPTIQTQAVSCDGQPVPYKAAIRKKKDVLYVMSSNLSNCKKSQWCGFLSIHKTSLVNSEKTDVSLL